jgi:hypothetical protein
VLLSVREPEEWVNSMRETVWGIFHPGRVIHHVSEARARIDPLWARFIDLMNGMNWDERTGVLAGETNTDEGLAAVMERWNDEVKATVPEERLLVWHPREGWEPLCEFVGADVPGEPLPRLNDTAAFQEGIIGGGLGVLNEWWAARDRPKESLHGAALS